MSESLEKVMYWFRQDLRLHDNIALKKAHAISKDILHVACNLTDEQTPWGFKRHSLNRHIFRRQAIEALGNTLAKHNQIFICLNGAINSDLNDASDTLTHHSNGASINLKTTRLIIDLARQHNIQNIFCEVLETPEEQQQVKELENAGLIVHGSVQSSLYEDNQLPFTVAQTPDIFTNFRQSVEQSNKFKAQEQPHNPLASLFPITKKSNNPFLNNALLATPVDHRSSFPFDREPWLGDENSALQHVSRYFLSPNPQTYKLTRNALTGIDYSTHFSPWLANGALSPRTIWQALKKHEQMQGANDSTYWIGFELLWREHFRLMARKHGAALFKQNGLKNIPQRNQSQSSQPPHQSHQSQQTFKGALAHQNQRQSTHDRASQSATQTDQNFQRWQTGETDHPFINAAMRELVTTGFLSNRLRQIVASYAIHDLGINWLLGAAWFEHCLIDYDVHSNQGNWAYIAGVGTDPRGGRQFNTDKQMKEYDPQGLYQKRWQA
jgi:deoxyribodipyrimidine photo-lyase